MPVGGVFLESGVAIDSSATMSQDVAIAFKAKNFSNAIALNATPGLQLTLQRDVLESRPSGGFQAGQQVTAAAYVFIG